MGQTAAGQGILPQDKNLRRHRHGPGAVLQDNNFGPTIKKYFFFYPLIYSAARRWPLFTSNLLYFCLLLCLLFSNQILWGDNSVLQYAFFRFDKKNKFPFFYRHMSLQKFSNFMVCQRIRARKLTGRRCLNLAERNGTESTTFWWGQNYELIVFVYNYSQVMPWRKMVWI